METLDTLLKRLEEIDAANREYAVLQLKQSGGSRLHYTAEMNKLLRDRKRVLSKINRQRQLLWKWD